MAAQFPTEAQRSMDERFGRDTLIALGTTDGPVPWVRAVNGYYENGSFYIITHARSNKMRQIQKNPTAAICGEWFTAHGVGEDMGYILDKKNEAIAAKLRAAFTAWYGNGHVDETDPHTCILRVRLTDGVLLSHGTRYEIDFMTDEPVKGA